MMSLKKKSVELSWLAEENRVQMEYLQDIGEELKQQNERITSQNILLENQSKEIHAQRDLLFQQKQNIIDSIQYASYIQNALLPNQNIIKKCFSDYFIMYQPRDIIGGDFYYFNRIDNILVFAVADCTGHGVPGALLSMLGIAFLTEITHQKEITRTNSVLDEMRIRLKAALIHNDKKIETRDGMDIALCALNLDNLHLQFSGVNLPVNIVRDSKLLHFETTKMPVGILYNDLDKFSLTEFQLQKEDIIYLFSDGFEDQIGGEANRKFMCKNFQEYLLSISSQKMADQKKLLEAKFSDWKGGNDQTDDILVIGLEV